MVDTAYRSRSLPIRRHILPPRVGYLVSDGPSSILEMGLALRFAGRCWGGGGHVVIPCRADGSIHPALFRILRWYNPDFVPAFLHSAAEMDELAPGWISEEMSRAGFAEDDALSRSIIEKDVIVDEKLLAAAQRLASGLPVFRSSTKHIALPSVVGSRDLPVQLSSIENDIDQTLLDQRVTVSNASSLMTASRLGCSGITHTHTNGSGSETQADSNDASFFMGGEASIFNGLVGQLDVLKVGRNISQVEGLIVIGASAEDAALSILWSRACGPSICFTSATGETLKERLRRFDALGHSREIIWYMTSCSLETSKLSDNFQSDLILPSSPTQAARPRWQIVSPESIPLTSLQFLASADQWDNRDTVHIIERDGEMVMEAPLAPLRPKFIRASSWNTIVAPEGIPVPPHVALADGQLLYTESGAFSEALTRPDLGGVSYSSQRMGIVLAGSSQDFRLSSPRLIFPGTRTVMEHIAARKGWGVRLSSAGKRTQYTIDKWGARTALIADLRGKPMSLLFEYRDVAQEEDEPRDDLRFRKTGIVALRWDHISTLPLLSDPDDHFSVRRLVDRWVSQEILHRGFILGCDRCSFVSFYDIEVISRTFRCSRCRHENVLTHDRWRRPADGGEPWHWFQLDPVILEWLTQNGHWPVLASEMVRMNCHGAASQMPEFEIFNSEGKALVESDFAVASEYDISWGEAKLNGCLDGNAKKRKADFEKFINHAGDLGIDKLYFATAAPIWSENFYREARTWKAAWKGRNVGDISLFTIDGLEGNVPRERNV